MNLKQAGLDILEGYFSTHDRRKKTRAAYAIDLKQFLGFPNWTAFLEQQLDPYTRHTGQLAQAWILPLAPLRV